MPAGENRNRTCRRQCECSEYKGNRLIASSADKTRSVNFPADRQPAGGRPPRFAGEGHCLDSARALIAASAKASPNPDQAPSGRLSPDLTWSVLLVVLTADDLTGRRAQLRDDVCIAIEPTAKRFIQRGFRKCGLTRRLARAPRLPRSDSRKPISYVNSARHRPRPHRRRQHDRPAGSVTNRRRGPGARSAKAPRPRHDGFRTASPP